MDRSWMRVGGVLCSVSAAMAALAILGPAVGLIQGEEGGLQAFILLVLAGLIFVVGLVCGLVALVSRGRGHVAGR